MKLDTLYLYLASNYLPKLLLFIFLNKYMLCTFKHPINNMFNNISENCLGSEDSQIDRGLD